MRTWFSGTAHEGAGAAGTMGNQFTRSAVLARILVGIAIFFCGLTGPGGWAPKALAASLPPTSSAQFSPATGLSGQTAILTIVFSNPNATPLTNVSTAVSSSNGAYFDSVNSDTCGATTSLASYAKAQISGIPLPGLASCTIKLTVKLPDYPGYISVYNNTNGISANESGATQNGTFYLGLNVYDVLTTSQAIPSITAYQSTPLGAALSPVTASGGNAPTFGISPSLPTGLSFNTANGEITGTPTATSSAKTYTVTATDQSSPAQTSSKTFQLQVLAVSPPNSALSYVYSGTPIAGQVVKGQLVLTNPNPVGLTGIAVSIHNSNGATYPSPANLVNGCGGSVNVGNGPSGLVVSGASLPALGSCTLTVDIVLPSSAGFTSIDTTSQAASATESGSAFGSMGYAVLTFYNLLTTTQAVSPLNFYQGVAISSVTPVTTGGGAPAITLGISPALPAGLQFNTSTGAITGTAAATSPTKTYTVTATDQANPPQASSKTFDLTVNSPVAATQAVASVTLTNGQPVASFTPVTGSGGVATLSYAVSPSLPAGLSLNPSTGAITGTPSGPSAARNYTVTVTDANNVSASNIFSLAVNSAVTATQAIATTTLTENHAATPFTPVTGGGGTSPLSYAVSPTLPPGLGFDTSSGQITGTPSTASAAGLYTVTVTDINGATATATFSLTVNGAVTATQAVATTTLTENHPATPFIPVTGAGGAGSLIYGVSPGLPPGLDFNTANGQVTGTPSVTSAAMIYTVTVTDANAATASRTFSLTVDSAVTATQAVATKSLTATMTVTPFTPVTGGGGTSPLSYSVSPALPPGLSFNATNGQVSGAPTVASAAANYTVTVTDANGATATNSFSLKVDGLAQTITFTSTPPSPVHVHSPDYLVSAIGGGSGEPVLFSIDASSGAGVCSISGSTVSFLSQAGSCVVNANQAGNAQYAAAQQAQQRITVVTTDIGAVAKAIGGFISDRANQIVSNQADFSGHGIGRLNEAARQNGGAGSSGLTDQEAVAALRSDLPLSAFASPLGAGGMFIPTAALASQGAGAPRDAYGLQAMLLGAVQNAGQSGSMGRFNYSGAVDAAVNAHDGFAASFHTSLSQIMKWQDAALGVNGSQGGGSHSYSPFDLWLEGIYAGYNGERSGQFGLFTAGTDYVINPNLLVGVFTQVDTMKQTSGTPISGTGWMAGPYATVRLTDQLFWTSRAGWGRSGNSLSDSGDFTSTRWLASTEVAGKWKLGQGITFTPNLGFTYFQDATDAYKDTFGVTIPGVKTELGQLKFSPELSYGFATDGGMWVEPSLAPELIWNFASTNVDGLGALSDTATGPTGLRGRIKAGLNLRTPRGAAFAVTGSYDGIGSSGYSAIAARAQISVPLN